ncbi:Cysteine and glycine-rich protein 1 [Linnemannia exigua]|uniref:Cysteine and glycine-rich protein 1 n=1 Tax=Linnemannia exigua TaxID=604196 RepID=A0AAD4HBJ7_9FUNG|nr:Cysteine and glycine-rich protein 1 [Linnemannia exigua]
MGFCHRCGDLVHGANCLKCGGRSVMSVTSGLPSTNSRNDPWINAYQNILEGGASKPSKRMSMPASVLSSSSPVAVSPIASKPQPLVVQKHCHGCSKQIHQAKVFVEPGRPTIIYCEKCYIEKFSKGNCPSCYKPVLTKSDPYVTHNRRSWHTPMVDLKGRPCCEDCLMAQAGAEHHSPMQENERTFGDSLTPEDRSLSSSPAPSPLRYPTSLRASTNDIDDTLDLTKRLQLNTSPRDLNSDYNLAQTNSPLSAQSYSSQSSFGANFKANTSSGNTSGTSSTHSSLGRNKRPDQSPSPTVLPTSVSNLLKSEQSLSVGSPFSYQRPGSALSVHSYTSSRPTSPAPPSHYGRDSRLDSTDDLDSTLRDKGLSSNGAEWNSRSESTLHGLRRSRSRSLSNIEGLESSVARPQSNGGSKYEPGSQSNSRPATPSTKPSALDAYPTSVKVDPFVPEPQPKQQIQLTQQPSLPPIGRSRSRSTVAPSSMGMVRARTEAWMNQAQSTTSPPAKTPSQQFNNLGLLGRGLSSDNRTVTSFNTSLKQSSTNLSEKDIKDPKTTVAPLEVEPNRSPLHRHGRQRSNTVGEAISFPSVKVDSPLTSPTQQRAASIPEGHCHRCYERVTENGIRLQNGDRYHIGCFLCNGCKQVFTESEFHIVFGRPYHPGCVSMAGTTSMMGMTKCQQCHKAIGNKAIRFAGQSFHPQCFTCTHCQKVLHSTSKFFEVDGRVECDLCCEERDRVRLPPKIVPVARGTDHFPAAPSMVASGPGLMATTTASAQGSSSHVNISRSGSMSGSPMSANTSGASSPLKSPGSPTFSYSSSANLLSDSRDQLDGGVGSEYGGMTSPVVMMASPSAARSIPPPLTSLFSTRTRPLPKFGGVTTCPRCQQAVGVMDQVPGPKNEKWHKKCLNCKECKKVLDSSALTRGEGEAFCRGCFNKTRIRI